MMGGFISFKYLRAEETCITIDLASRSEMVLCWKKKKIIRQIVLFKSCFAHWDKKQLSIEITMNLVIEKCEFLWKIRFWNCEFCEKWDFEKVIFLKNVNFLKMRFSKCEFLWKMRLWNCEFGQKWYFQNVFLEKNRIFLQCVWFKAYLL